MKKPTVSGEHYLECEHAGALQVPIGLRVALFVHEHTDARPMRRCKKLFTLLDLCVSSLRRGHANLLCIVPILTDDPRRESNKNCFERRRASHHDVILHHHRPQKGGVASVAPSRGHCISFWPAVPPLQVAPSFACSVASLNQSPGR
jgi:hypothetical protein